MSTIKYNIIIEKEISPYEVPSVFLMCLDEHLKRHDAKRIKTEILTEKCKKCEELKCQRY